MKLKFERKDVVYSPTKKLIVYLFNEDGAKYPVSLDSAYENESDEKLYDHAMQVVKTENFESLAITETALKVDDVMDMMETLSKETKRSVDTITANFIRAVDLTPEIKAELFSNFSPFTAGIEYEVGDIITYEGNLYKVVQAHTSQGDWTPLVSKSLFADYQNPTVTKGEDTVTVIPEWTQPDSTNPFKKGDHVMFNGKEYVSTADANVWAPDAYGWTEVV